MKCCHCEEFHHGDWTESQNFSHQGRGLQSGTTEQQKGLGVIEAQSCAIAEKSHDQPCQSPGNRTRPWHAPSETENKPFQDTRDIICHSDSSWDVYFQERGLKTRTAGC